LLVEAGFVVAAAHPPAYTKFSPPDQKEFNQISVIHFGTPAYTGPLNRSLAVHSPAYNQAINALGTKAVDDINSLAQKTGAMIIAAGALMPEERPKALALGTHTIIGEMIVASRDSVFGETLPTESPFFFNADRTVLFQVVVCNNITVLRDAAPPSDAITYKTCIQGPVVAQMPANELQVQFADLFGAAGINVDINVHRQKAASAFRTDLVLTCTPLNEAARVALSEVRQLILPVRSSGPEAAPAKQHTIKLEASPLREQNGVLRRNASVKANFKDDEKLDFTDLFYDPATQTSAPARSRIFTSYASVVKAPAVPASGPAIQNLKESQQPAKKGKGKTKANAGLVEPSGDGYTTVKNRKSSSKSKSNKKPWDPDYNLFDTDEDGDIAAFLRGGGDDSPAPADSPPTRRLSSRSPAPPPARFRPANDDDDDDGKRGTGVNSASANAQTVDKRGRTEISTSTSKSPSTEPASKKPASKKQPPKKTDSELEAERTLAAHVASIPVFQPSVMYRPG
jgi:hypothetical protein